jgi:superfamily II DNA or RNA helicase
MDIKEMNRVLTSKGYAIKKSSLTELQIKQIRKSLLLKPKVNGMLRGTSVSISVLEESSTRFYVPRQWGIDTFGEPEETIISEGCSFADTIQLHDFAPHEFQKEIIEAFMVKRNGLICVPCGYGKTFMALQIAFRMGKRFMIVVDKEFLMNQWKSEIEQFMKGACVGILQADTIQTGRQYDITIVMIQTLCRREFPRGFFDEYGFTIFDECHHLGSAYFCNALRKIQTKWMLGLSATPEREDGMTCIFEYFLGKAVYKKTQREPDKEAIVKAIWFQSEDPVYSDVPVNHRGETVAAKLLNQVADYEPRNQKMLEVILQYVKDPFRFILILSDRISQLEWFDTQLKQRNTIHGFYIGGMKQSVLDDNATRCQILLATYQMASEAFSVKKLNTVLLATPRKNVQQSTGRIFRERMEERKLPPHIIDIVDSHDTHMRRWNVRKKFYMDCEYTIEYIDRPIRKKKEKEEKEEKEEKCMIQL